MIPGSVAPVLESESEPEPEEDREPEPDEARGVDSVPSPAARPSRNDGSAAPASAGRSPLRALPAFEDVSRYGEAVVREILDARFIEEQPLPPASSAWSTRPAEAPGTTLGAES